MSRNNNSQSSKAAAYSFVPLLQNYEKDAIALREKAGVDLQAQFDPHLLIDHYKVKVIDLSKLAYLSPADLDKLRQVSVKEWSGMGVPLDNGSVAVALHPSMTLERARVTLMEEIAHIYYEHAPSKVERLTNGWVKREYNQEIEDQAYQTAAAVLLPSKVVAFGVWKCHSGEQLAAQYSVSLELVEMRIKVLNLWDQYQNGLAHSGESNNA